MLREPKTINVDPNSELGHLLDEAKGAPLVLEMNGVRYLLSREENSWPGMSDEEYQRVLNETLGSWSDIDADAMIDYIYRGREEGTRPIDRPYNSLRDSGLYTEHSPDAGIASVDDDKRVGE